MLSEQNFGLDSEYQRLISQDKEMRIEYEARQKALRDYNQGILEAERRGEQRGERRGEDRKVHQIARNLIMHGLSAEMIAAATGLTAEQVEDCLVL